MGQSATEAGIEVLWRPGCPYCSGLRRGLRQAGVTATERNIWADPAAAARVRAATGGDETVPTVLVGRRALVNPSVPEVLAAIRAEMPDADRLLGSAEGTPSGSATASAGWRAAARWTVAAAALWAALALWRPTTTWHLGPVLVAAAAPWLVRQGTRAGDRRGAVARLTSAAAAGFLTAAAVTVALDGAGLLRGPALFGLPGAGAEALVLAGVGAGLPTARGLLGALRGPGPVRSAWLDGQLLARSADVVMVEGNAYFPAEAISPGVLTPSATRTLCPWKGVAGYYTVTVGGLAHPDTAWTYRHPSPLARRIKDRVAFWGDVEVRVEPRTVDDGPSGPRIGGSAQERTSP